MGTKTKLLISALIISAIAGGYFFYVADQNNTPTPVEESNDKFEEGTQIPKEEPQTNEQENTENETSRTVDVFISNISQDGSMVYISATVDDATSGTCTAILRKPGHPTVEKSSELQLVTSYYACQMDIPKSQIPAKGEWEVVVKFSSQTASGESNSATVNVK